MATKDNDKGLAERWLAAELDRIWLLAERALRALQKAQIRPQPGHPSMAEIEGVLAARRAARLGPNAKPEDDSQLDKAIAASEEEVKKLRVQAPIGRLIANLELRPLEVEILVTAMAPQIEAPLGELLAIVRGQAGGRNGVDLALVAQLFRLKRAERLQLLDGLDPARPLEGWGLVQLMPADSLPSFGSMTYRAIRPNFQLIQLLCREEQLDPRLARATKLATAKPDLDDLVLDDDMRVKVNAACEAARAQKGKALVSHFPCLLLWGANGAGKRTLAGRIAANAGKPLLLFDPAMVEPAMFMQLLQRVQWEALARDAMLYIGPLIPELLKDNARELVKRLEHFGGMLAIGIDAMQPPMIVSGRPMRELHVQIPSELLRKKLWDTHLPESKRGPDVRVDLLSGGFKLTPGEIVGTCREALSIATGDNDRKVVHADLRNGVERRMRNQLGEQARRLSVTVRWEDLVLPEQDMARIQEFISRKKHSDKVYNAWGFGPRVGYGKGLVALFSGPPGTGKTMLAQLIAKSLDLDIYQVDLAQVLSKWVGETEKQLAKVFDNAERAHAVLLFDEADSLFAKRTEVKTSNDRYANLVVNYLLQRLEQYDGIAVLTTNKEAQLDEALQRRLSMHLRLEIPEIDERKRLWRSFMPSVAPVADEIDFDALARGYELSGGYIKNAALRAAFLAAARDVPIDMGLLRLASGLELEDMGRVIVRKEEMTLNAAGDVVFDFTDA